MSNLSNDTMFTIISGGSPGIDTAALVVAKKLNLSIDGYTPKNYWSGGKCNYELRTIYGLKEVQSNGHKEKEEKNINLCDGLLAFRFRIPNTGRGTESTINCALYGEYKHSIFSQDADIVLFDDIKSYKKPVILLWDISDDKFELYGDTVIKFIKKHNIKKLMVSGSTDNSLEPLICKFMEHILKIIITRNN